MFSPPFAVFILFCFSTRISVDHSCYSLPCVLTYFMEYHTNLYLKKKNAPLRGSGVGDLTMWKFVPICWCSLENLSWGAASKLKEQDQPLLLGVDEYFLLLCPLGYQCSGIQDVEKMPAKGQKNSGVPGGAWDIAAFDPLVLCVCVCGGACSSLSTDQQRTLWSGRLKVRVVGSACQSLALPSGDLGVFWCLSGNPGCKQESAGRTTSSIITALWGTGWSSRACSWFLDLFTGIWSFLRPGIFCLLA